MPRFLQFGLRCSACCLFMAFVASFVSARPLSFFKKNELQVVNSKLQGRILDFTQNHGCDRRIWSNALCSKRDVYVYLPPGYDGVKQFPLLIWLHGFSQDEESFLGFATIFDQAIVSGKFPPVVLVIPDGSIRGQPTPLNAGSFFLNSRAGNFEDYLMMDLWHFLCENFAIRPEKEAHALAGASMGGFSAFNLGIKYRDRFGVIAGILPLVNLRYSDCRGRRFADFDPNCQGWVERYRPMAYSGRIMHVIPVFQGRAMRPLAPRKEMRDFISAENPVEMLLCYDVQPGELAMWVGYGTRDSFNVDAQSESFIWHAQERGISVKASIIPGGAHDRITAKKLFPPLAQWLGQQLGPYAPCCYPALPITAPQHAPAPLPIIAWPSQLVPH